MLNLEEVVEIRVSAKRGQSIRQPAQAMGMSRNTVRRYLRGAPAQRPASWSRSSPVPSRHMPFAGTFLSRHFSDALVHVLEAQK